MSHEAQVYVKSDAEFNYLKQQRRKDMRGQLTTFAIMIFFTLIAFTTVAADFSKYLIAPVILLLAVVQVILQLFYFMHMSEKNHNVPMYFLFVGAFFGFIFILTFLTIIWWG